MQLGRMKWLGFALMVMLVSAVHADGQEPFEYHGAYPDVWYRMTDWPNVVRGLFLSDKATWGDEPVVVIGPTDSERATAKGFFSGTEQAVVVKKGAQSLKYYYDDGSGIGVHPLDIEKVTPKGFFNGKERAVVVINGKEWPVIVEKGEHSLEFYYESGGALIPVRSPAQDILHRGRLADGTELGIGQAHNLVLASLPGGGSEFRKGEELPNAVIARNCEPMDKTLTLTDARGTLIWDRAAVRYFSMNEEAPPEEMELEQECGGLKAAWLSVGVGRMVLMLEDGTLLMTGTGHQKAQATFVVRLRLKDGTSGRLPPELAIIDNPDIIQAKLDLLRKYKHEMMLRDLTNDEFMASKEFSVERVYRDLAHYFFKEKEDTHLPRPK